MELKYCIEQFKTSTVNKIRHHCLFGLKAEVASTKSRFGGLVGIWYTVWVRYITVLAVKFEYKICLRADLKKKGNVYE